LVRVDKNFNKTALLIDSLQRPVCFVAADLDNDGKKDYVVGAFGNYTGQLLVFEKEKNMYHKHVISGMPGTRRVIVKDVNSDGLKDLLVLMAQGNERISLFLNSGNFQFKEKVLLRFPPVYGSSYFE